MSTDFWPSLLDVPGFLLQFVTPIVKATKGDKTYTFFTLPEYEKWKEKIGDSALKGYTIKYYKVNKSFFSFYHKISKSILTSRNE